LALLVAFPRFAKTAFLPFSFYNTIFVSKRLRMIVKDNRTQGRTQGMAEGARVPLNGNRLNTNLLLTFVKTQNNSAHAYIAI